MGMVGQPTWFVITSGKHAGRPHMVGWMMSAIKGESTADDDNGWLSYSICPRCHAMVMTDDKPGHGDQQWAHEAWHAATDWPIPDEVRAQMQS